MRCLRPLVWPTNPVLSNVTENAGKQKNITNYKLSELRYPAIRPGFQTGPSNRQHILEKVKIEWTTALAFS